MSDSSQFAVAVSKVTVLVLAELPPLAASNAMPLNASSTEDDVGEKSSRSLGNT